MATEHYVRSDGEMLADRLMLAAMRRTIDKVGRMLERLPRDRRARPWKDALDTMADECMTIQLRLENDET